MAHCPSRLSVLAALALGGCFGEETPIETESGASADSTGADGSSTTSGTSSTTTTTTGMLDDDTGTGSSSGAGSSGEVSTGSVAECGNGIVDDGEMCDGGAGCDASCGFTDYACNPLNDAGCLAPDRCGLIDFDLEQVGCIPPGQGDLGAACSYTLANDSECQAGLTCLFNSQTPLCDIGNCCVYFCDLNDPNPPGGPTEICMVFFPAPTKQGLEHLGFCGG